MRDVPIYTIGRYFGRRLESCVIGDPANELRSAGDMFFRAVLSLLSKSTKSIFIKDLRNGSGNSDGGRHEKNMFIFVDTAPNPT